MNKLFKQNLRGKRITQDPTIRPGTIKTFTGKTIDLLNLKPADIDIRDIAHSLSMQCRFGGHTQKFYSVAEHSFWVYRFYHKYAVACTNREALGVLLHDGAEGYFQDLCKPIKVLCPMYDLVEKRAQEMIWKKFGCKGMDLEKLKRVDREICELERNHCRNAWTEYFNGWGPARAEATFLETFRQLTTPNSKML